jgi:hypothetical protein
MRFRTPTGAENFSPHYIQTCSGSQWIQREKECSLGDRAAGMWSYHPAPSNIENTKAWITSSRPIEFTRRLLGKALYWCGPPLRDPCISIYNYMQNLLQPTRSRMNHVSEKKGKELLSFNSSGECQPVPIYCFIIHIFFLHYGWGCFTTNSRCFLLKGPLL